MSKNIDLETVAIYIIIFATLAYAAWAFGVAMEIIK